MRKLAQNAAKVSMKKKGMVRFCKHPRGNRSYFAQHWREYVRRQGHFETKNLWKGADA